MPSRDQTGLPHFHSSTTSGSASWIRRRNRASVSPRQSGRAAMRWSISSAGVAPVARSAALFLPKLMVPFSHLLAGKAAGLPHPVGEPGLVDLVFFIDIEITHIWLLGCARGRRVEMGAFEEGDFQISGHAVIAHEPVIFLGAVKGRVPLHRLFHAGHRLFD